MALTLSHLQCLAPDGVPDKGAGCPAPGGSWEVKVEIAFRVTARYRTTSETELDSVH